MRKYLNLRDSKKVIKERNGEEVVTEVRTLEV